MAPVSYLLEMWALVGIVFVVWFVLVAFFMPRIDYRIGAPPRLDSDEFFHVLQATCQAAVVPGNRVEILTNGSQFYPSMLEAIRAARASVNLEAYIFEPGEIAERFIDALVERARAGVEVRVVLDSIGSSRMGGAPVRRLRSAGCHVYFYQSISVYRLHRLNNRTHRELLIVDGAVAFTGGAGVADWWVNPGRRGPAWRDTMARLEGPIVTALQGVFAENWLECSGEILIGPRHWRRLHAADSAEGMLVKSSPSDRATASRVVFQMLIEGAEREIAISTPYFLPDRSLRQALVRAVQRGVRVRVLVPGRLADQRLVRLASRRMYRELLDAGIRLFEYRPAMMHAKALMVDGTWAVVGTTNVDNRSFEHNDEVNVAFRDPAITERLLRDFETDLAMSDEITSPTWRARPVVEKLVEPVCWILERQQ
ncbi:MAG: cardiolipin synthase B [Acidobacteria bacterium]|nr:cardiolipin synthase B [Acidobacteriota bacterium]